MSAVLCCAAGICCQPGSAKAKKALADHLFQEADLSVEEAERVVAALAKSFDLVPRGAGAAALATAKAAMGIVTADEDLTARFRAAYYPYLDAKKGGA